MKKRIIKINVLFGMLALIAGILFLTCGFATRLPKGTTVGGVPVGGLTRAAAVAAVRADVTEKLKQKQLVICADENVYTYAYPEIGFADDLVQLVKGIARRGEYTPAVRYYLNGEDIVVSGICADVNVQKEEPSALFRGGNPPFAYAEGRDGRTVDADKLKRDIGQSLNGSFERVYASFVEEKREKSMEDIAEQTKLLSAFSTEYDASNEGRSNNIALACKKINGTVLAPRGEFSFNGVVGPRTAEKGFTKAKIIEGGRFVDGFGGGVCQVSTTLYNAALLAGCRVTEYHPHSLQVSYVPASRDAMVSGTYFDLKFKNLSDCPLYICAVARGGTLTCRIYGKSDGAEYFLSSEVTEVLPPPPAEEVEGLEEGFIVNEKYGAVSIGYLTVTRNGQSQTVVLRNDKYASVRGVKSVKRQEEAPPQTA